MTNASAIARFLNEELRPKRIRDYSRNGLQVQTEREIRRVGFAVDASLSTFKKAKKEGIDLLVVHHGIKWVPQKYKEVAKARIAYLERARIGLYACHLPLDMNEEYGNNIELARILNLEDVKGFGAHHKLMIGYQGRFSNPMSISHIAARLDGMLNTECDVYPFGKAEIRTIGIVSGGGSSAIEEAVEKKLDCFLVGEINHGDCCRARDYGLNMIAAGHYATETVGVKALMPAVRNKFGVRTIFIDNPTGL